MRCVDCSRVLKLTPAGARRKRCNQCSKKRADRIYRNRLKHCRIAKALLGILTSTHATPTTRRYRERLRLILKRQDPKYLAAERAKQRRRMRKFRADTGPATA